MKNISTAANNKLELGHICNYFPAMYPNERWA